MFCPRCGSRNPDGATACVNCGWSMVSGVGGTYAAGVGKPDNYLIPAILSFFFCCQVFGLISIVYAALVETRWSAGDVTGAQDASRLARNWAIAAFAGGFIWVGFLLVAILMPVMISAPR
jgi:hypothetical protein